MAGRSILDDSLSQYLQNLLDGCCHSLKVEEVGRAVA